MYTSIFVSPMDNSNADGFLRLINPNGVSIEGGDVGTFVSGTLNLREHHFLVNNRDINGVNLRENILPTRDRADLIIEKGTNHVVDQMRLRKL